MNEGVERKWRCAVCLVLCDESPAYERQHLDCCYLYSRVCVGCMSTAPVLTQEQERAIASSHAGVCRRKDKR